MYFIEKPIWPDSGGYSHLSTIVEIGVDDSLLVLNVKDDYFSSDATLVFNKIEALRIVKFLNQQISLLK